jgi:hypothetical protein
MKPVLAIFLLCSCAGPVTTREPSGKITVKSSMTTPTTVEVSKDGTVTVSTRPPSIVESAIAGAARGLATWFKPNLGDKTK